MILQETLNQSERGPNPGFRVVGFPVRSFLQQMVELLPL